MGEAGAHQHGAAAAGPGRRCEQGAALHLPQRAPWGGRARPAHAKETGGLGGLGKGGLKGGGLGGPEHQLRDHRYPETARL